MPLVRAGWSATRS